MLNILKNISRHSTCANPTIIRNCVDEVHNLQRAFISIVQTKERKFGIGVREEVAKPVHEIQKCNSNEIAKNMFLWIDVDCFECQLLSFLHPEIRNGPLVIVGSKPKQKIFALDYAARSCGISKFDTVESARLKCPNLIVFEPQDTTKKEHVLMKERIELSLETFIKDELSDRVEIYAPEFEEFALKIGEEFDEILSTPNGFTKYPDNPWTDNTKWISGDGNHEKAHNDDEDVKRLQIGANILAEILRRLELDTGLYASGGVAHSSHFARLACALNKPRGITVVTNDGVEELFSLDVERKKAKKRRSDQQTLSDVKETG